VHTTQDTSLIDRIPDPEEVRSRLVACTKEAAVLRELLRVAERAKRERESLRTVGVNGIDARRGGRPVARDREAR
jgi:hypothetical protein